MTARHGPSDDRLRGAAGGAFYIASFSVALHYAEFIGIVLLFVGLTDFSRWLTPSPRGPRARRGATRRDG